MQYFNNKVSSASGDCTPRPSSFVCNIPLMLSPALYLSLQVSVLKSLYVHFIFLNFILYYCMNFACEDYTQGRGFTQLQTSKYNHWLLIKFLKVSIEVTSLIQLGRLFQSLGQVILRLQHMLLQTFSAGTLLSINRIIEQN